MNCWFVRTNGDGVSDKETLIKILYGGVGGGGDLWVFGG